MRDWREAERSWTMPLVQLPATSWDSKQLPTLLEATALELEESLASIYSGVMQLLSNCQLL